MDCPADNKPESVKLLDTVPADELPREKLFLHGRRALSDEELIAIFLRTGMQGCNVLQLAALVKKAAGSLADLGQMEAADILNLVKGIGKAKAATLAAGFELGQRATRDRMQRCDMSSAASVYEYLVGELRFESQEVLCVLLIDARRRLIRVERVAAGTLTRMITHARNVFSPAIRYNACKIILAHNHPSGNTSPSEQDKALTRAIAEAGHILGIPLMDHVIIGAADNDFACPYFSFAEHGLI
ncbi:MAG: JAB domain-containing protein [Akkermansiaceae bacterium]|nr:JAB domain-containing protein [Akkermansiaceae bacterium]